MNVKEYCIISDGACDLPVELTNKKNIPIVPFYVSFDDTNYYKEQVEIGIRDFYERMVKESNVYPKSSMPAIQDFVDVMLPKVKAGIACIVICITTKFSGSYQSAMSAKEIVLEEYPDAQITVIDSTVDTVLQGIYVLEAIDMCEKGVPYEDCIAELQAIKSTGRIFFTVGNMEYLQHGGRIGKLAGLAVSVLGIKPLITLKEGEIFPSGITRSRLKSQLKVIELLLNYIKTECAGCADDYEICIGYGYDKSEAEEFREKAVKAIADAGYGNRTIELYQIGATIGVHTGPYPLGFGIIKKNKF